MAHFEVNGRCNGCLACVENCPAGALRHEDREDTRVLLHNPTRCARCGRCWRVCPREAVEFHRLLEGDWEEVTAMDLVRCEVCGEPLYTVAYRDALDTSLGQPQRALCPRHRTAHASVAWRHLAAPRAGTGR